MSKIKLIQLCILLFTFVFAGCKEKGSGNFTPGELWPDNNGVHINAHGGGILHVGAVSYTHLTLPTN